MSELQIEEGKWYRTRGGDIVGPMAWSGSERYPWVADGVPFRHNGRWCGDGTDDSDDLVEEVPAPQAIHVISRLLDDVDEVPAPLPQNPVEKYLPSVMTAADLRSEIDRLQSEVDARMRDDGEDRGTAGKDGLVSELQIEEGKWYRRRDGAVVGPAWRREPGRLYPWRREPGRLYPWCLGKHEMGDTIYADDGRFAIDGRCAKLDLVEEVPAPLPQNPVDIAIAAEIDAETAATTFGPLGQYAASDDTECTRDLLRNGIFVPDQKMALPRRAVDIAGKAASLVGGDRDRQHGAKHDNFRRIAGVWNAWLAIRKDPSAPLDAHDVGCMMALMKLARTQSGALNVDDYVDACGYAACAGEVAQINET